MIKNRIHYLTRRTLLTFFGPADLAADIDPIVKIERERDERFGARPVARRTVHIPRRHFHGSHAA